MKDTKKADIILNIEQLRLVETELFRLTSKYGIKTIDELDNQISKGKISEQAVGDDLFVLDELMSKQEEILKKLESYNIKRKDVWKSFQDLLGLQKLNSGI